MGTIRFHHAGPVTSLAFRPDSKVLASAGQDNSIRLWDLSRGKELRRLSPAQGEFADATLVHAVAWSADGRYLASGTSTRTWTVRLWSAETGEELQRFRELRFDVTGLAFSPDSRQLVGAGRDGKVCVWDLTGVKAPRLFAAHVGEVRALALSPDGKVLACCGNSITLLELATGKVIRDLKGHQRQGARPGRQAVAAVAFSRDGSQLFSGGEDSNICVWDSITGRKLKTLSSAHYHVLTLAINPAGHLLASTGLNGGISLWDTRDWKRVQELRTLRGAIPGSLTLCFSGDGKTLASGGRDQTVQLWDVASGKEINRQGGHESSVQSVVFSADGKALATTGFDFTLRLWEAATGKESRVLAAAAAPTWGGWFHFAAFTRDGRHLLAANTDKVRRWDLHAGKELLPLDPTHGHSTHVALSADGKLVAASEPGYAGPSGPGNRVFVADLITGKEMLRLPAAKALVAALALSHDGKYLAVASHGSEPDIRGFIAVWNTLTGKRIWQFDAPKTPFGVIALLFSSDNRILVAGDHASMPSIRPASLTWRRARSWPRLKGRFLRCGRWPFRRTARPL